MNQIERIKMVKAMEYICRQINDEEVFDGWLINGVADGDINYGDLSVNKHDGEWFEYYVEDESFADLMACFLRRMRRAYTSGGLFCDGVVSTDPEPEDYKPGRNHAIALVMGALDWMRVADPGDDTMRDVAKFYMRMSDEDIKYFGLDYLLTQDKEVN